jgi:hypothetical protein
MLQSTLLSIEKKDLNVHNIEMDECLMLNVDSQLYKTIYSDLHKKYIDDTFAKNGWFSTILYIIFAIIIGIISKSWIIGILAFFGIAYLLNRLITLPLALEKYKNIKLPIKQINILRKKNFDKFEITYLGNVIKENQITGKIIDNIDHNVYVDFENLNIKMYFTIDEFIYLKNIDIKEITKFVILKDERVYNSIKELEHEFHRKQQQKDLIEATEKITKPILSTKVIGVHNSQVNINKSLKKEYQKLNLLYIILSNGDKIVLSNLNMDMVNLIENQLHEYT